MILVEQLEKYHLILGSKSPRRSQLLKELGIPFQVIAREVNEDIPDGKDGIETACQLALLKAEAYKDLLADPANIVLTADTVVWHHGRNLAKPAGPGEAAEMLEELSGSHHEVITGVCLSQLDRRELFYAVSKVWFKELSSEEISYYIEHYKPFDKAGAYGVQEWIGLIGITRIEGSYFNIVGLPVQEVYEALLKFTD